MKFKHLLLTAVASVLLGTEAFAASAYGYDAVSNEALYTSMMRNLRTLQTDLIGEPIYFMAQNLMLEIQAVHKEKPYAWVGQVHRFISLAENAFVTLPIEQLSKRDMNTDPALFMEPDTAAAARFREMGLYNEPVPDIVNF